MSMDAQPPLPEGWEWKKLGDVFSLQYGKGLPKRSRALEGSVPVYGSNGPVGYHNSSLVNCPCIIVGRKGSAGAVHLSKTPSWPIDTTYFVIPPSNINIQFAYFLLSSIGLDKLDRSTAIPGLNRDDAYSLTIPLPPPSVQEAIVAKIEELFTQLDAAEAALKRARANLKRYRQSVLQAAVTGELTREWREQNAGSVEPAAVLLERIRAERRARWEADLRAKGKDPAKAKYVEPQPPDTRGLPELPEGWAWARTEQLGEVGTGATPLRSKTYYYEGGSTPWVTSGALNDLFVDESEELITEKAIQETNAKIFPSGTLLIAMYGEGKTRGKVSELRIAAATNQAIAAIVLEGMALKAKEYLKLFYQYNYENIRRLSSGGVQPNLNLSIVKDTPIPIPSIEEQQEVMDRAQEILSNIFTVEENLIVNLSRISRLRQSILQRAFTGQLLSQEPTP